MTTLFKNFAYSTLASAVSSSSQTTVSVQTGHGDRFPVCNQGGTGGDNFHIVLKNTAGTREIINIVRRDTGSDVMTVGVTGSAAASATGRGNESTTATTWIIGDVVQHIDTAGDKAQFATANEALTSVSGTDTIAGTAPAAITAYVTNQVFRFIASGTNTGAATLNVSGLGAKTIYKAGSTALAAGDIVSGMAVTVVYDGTQFQLIGNGQTTIPVTQGGTGRTTGTTAYALVATGTTATGAQQSLAAGATTEILVGGGASALPVWTAATGSGAPVRATSPSLTTPALGTPSSGTLTNCTGPATMIPAASSGVNGYMTGTYATKLDGIAAGAQPGTVTSVSGSAPVSSSGGTTPAISMAAATAAVNGYMTSTYASKLDGIAAGATNVTNNNQISNGAGYITSAGSCAYATSAGNADTVDSQHFAWSNSDNNPSYLWGANTNGSSFLAARGSMSVNYADYSGYTTGSSASCTGNAATATTATNFNNGTAYSSGGTVYATTFSGNVTGSSGSCTGNAASATTAAACSGNTAGTAANITAYTINQSVGTGNSPSFVDVTITSDATLKMNWKMFDGGLLDRLAKVKRGIYDRKDVKLRQVGVSAQSLKKALPEMVTEVDGKLQISQSGTLALVLELAEEVRRLRELLK